MRILLIEDNPGDARLIREMLTEINEGAAEPAELECEETLASGLERLGNEHFDVLLLDLTLPDSRGLETLQKVHPFELKVPVVVLTGLDDDETAQKALEGGAQDYLVKGKITADSLERFTRYALGRHAAEERLRRSEEAYHRALITQAMDCITVLDGNGIIVYESPSITPLLGYSQEELVGRSVFDLIHPEDAPAAVEAFMEGIKASTEYGAQTEVRFKHKDGSWRTFWGLGRNLLDDPDVAGIILNSRDVTERKEAEEALRESERKLKLAQEIGRIGSWEYNVDSGKIEWSLETYRLYERDPALGTPTEEEEAEYYSEEQAQMLRQYAACAIAEGKDFEYDLEVRLSGDRRAFFAATMRPVKEDNGRVVKLFGTVQDITERKEAQAALKESEQKYRQMFENMSSGVAVFEAVDDGEDFVFVDFNRAAEKIEGVDKIHLLGRTVSEVFPGVTTFGFLDVFRRVWRTGEPEHRPGTRYSDERVADSWREYSAYKLPSGVLVVIYDDITERKLAEEALREAEERYREIIENAPFGYYRVDKGGLWQYVNPAWKRMHGFSLDEDVIGKPFEITQPEDAVEQARDIVRRTLAGESITGEFSRLTLDGEVEHHSFITQPVMRGAEVVAIEGFIIDITDRKLAEEMLHRTQFSVDHSANSVFWVTSEGKIIYANEEACRRRGYTKEEMLSLEIFDINVDFASDPGKWETSLDRMRESGHFTAEFRHRTKGGEVFPVEATLNSFDLGGGWFFVADVHDITERKEAEEELKDSEERYETALRTSPVGLAMSDLEGKLIWASERSLEQRGGGREDLLGMSLVELIHPDDREKAVRLLSELLPQGSLRSVEARLLKKDGSYFHSLINAVVVNDRSGNPSYILGTSMDITERKEAEEALRRTSSYLESLLDYANAPIIVWDTEFKIQRFNHAFERLSGYKADEVIGRKLSVLKPQALDESLGDIACALSDEFLESMEMPILTKDGNTRVVLWNSANIYDEDRKTIITTIAQGQDITERKAAEEALLKSEEHFRLLFESSRDALMILSPPSWKFTSCNLVALEMFEAKDESEFTSLSPWRLSPDLQPDRKSSAVKAREMIDKALRDGSFLFDWTHKRLGGEEFPAMVMLTRMRIGGDTVVQASVRDITERKKAEEEVKSLASRLLEEDDKVRATIAADLHDGVGQLLITAKMAFDMHLKKMAGTIDEEMGESMASIRAMLSEAIGKVRDISVRLVPVELIDSGLDIALRNYLEAFARDTGVTCAFKTEGARVQVGVEVKTALFRIAQEALANIRRHSKASSVEVSISWSELLVSLSVSDDGAGFDVEKAYEESRTGEHFGLVAMRERARMLKGELSLESKPGEGTTVTVRVPLECG